MAKRRIPEPPATLYMYYCERHNIWVPARNFEEAAFYGSLDKNGKPKRNSLIADYSYQLMKGVETRYGNI